MSDLRRTIDRPIDKWVWCERENRPMWHKHVTWAGDIEDYVPCPQADRHLPLRIATTDQPTGGE